MYRSHVGGGVRSAMRALSNLEGGAMTRMVERVPRRAVPSWDGMLERESSLALGARRSTAQRLYCSQRLAYHLGFSGELRTRFITDRDIRKVRAMSEAFTPALNDARMRFAVPSGIFSIPPILSLPMLANWPGDDALVAAAAVSLLGRL